MKTKKEILSLICSFLKKTAVHLQKKTYNISQYNQYSIYKIISSFALRPTEEDRIILLVWCLFILWSTWSPNSPLLPDGSTRMPIHALWSWQCVRRTLNRSSPKWPRESWVFSQVQCPRWSPQNSNCSWPNRQRLDHPTRGHPFVELRYLLYNETNNCGC